jgi:hypothetical protein
MGRRLASNDYGGTSLAAGRGRREDGGVKSDRRARSVWWQMISGMRAYGVAITVVWAMCACTVLLVLAVSVGGLWSHVGFASGALVELALSGLTLRFLARASVRGRFDT